VYETLTSPLQYDTVVPGHALSANQLRNLQILCEGFHITAPKQWSVLAQKRVVDQLRKYGRGQRDLLSAFLMRLKEHGEAGETVSQVEDLLSKWLALEKGEHELQAFQHFEAAAGPPHRFAMQANELASLPQRFEKLLRETQRFRHLFSHPAVAQSPNADVAVRLAALESVPPLSQPEALEAWLERANALYGVYQQSYRESHEQWRDGVSRHPVWSYRIPSVARSRPLMAGDLVRKVEALLAQAREERCPGLTSLEFQPVCRCGFDGAESRLSETLRRFESASQKLETEIRLFFQQDRVKSKFRDWVNHGLEVSTPALSYLEGKRHFPEVENLSLFDQYLSGLELVKPVEAETLVDMVADRVWERPALLKAIEDLFDRAGPRIVFRRNAGDQPARKELAAWCYEQALRNGVPLPAVFSPEQQRLAAELIDPRWIAEASLLKVDQMGLGEAAIQRVLDMVLKGLVRAPEHVEGCGPVTAARELLNPSSPCSADELAKTIQSLYMQHGRFMKIEPQRWLALLDRLATAELPGEPRPLEERLREHLDAQWLVVDCLGIPLLDVLQSVLRDSLPQWKLQAVEFAFVSPRTSTEAFYITLIEKELKKAFDKIDAVDHLIHERSPNMEDLARLARAELEIAFRKLGRRLDPGKPVLIFGDHGFRLAADGRSFTHGGSSTLERLTPLLLLS
jgi:hypothetical protein